MSMLCKRVPFRHSDLREVINQNDQHLQFNNAGPTGLIEILFILSHVLLCFLQTKKVILSTNYVV